MNSPMRFRDRVVVVSGASSGLGEAATRKLAREGAKLVLLAADSDRERLDMVVADIEATGSDVVCLSGDLSEPATSQEAIRTAMKVFGQVDHLVNNAGIGGPVCDFLDETLESYDRVMAVNARGMYLLAHEAARAMASGNGGSIVFTASGQGLRALERFTSYNMSKGAVVTLARALGAALAPYGIRVNAVAPGMIATEAVLAWLEAEPGSWAKQRARIPADRPGTPDEVANLILFLLSDEASYVTGAVVTIDGGDTAGWRSSDWKVLDEGDAGTRRQSLPPYSADLQRD